METNTLFVTFAFVCAFFFFSKAEAGEPYHIKKSSLCFTDQDKEICTSKTYDFHAVVREIVDDIKENKVSRKQKGIGKDSGVCANTLKDAICSEPSPLCFEKNDESDAKEVCDKLRRGCPLLKDDDFDEYEDGCVNHLQKEVFMDLTCVAIGEDEKFKGYCPKPSGKMPRAYWEAYKAKSEELEDPMEYLETANQFTNELLVSNDCMKKIKEVVCVPLYCTGDEKSVIVPNLEDKCNDVMKCINNVFGRYSKLSTMLEPIKKHLNEGCTKIVNAVKAAADSSSSGRSHAQSTNLYIGLNFLVIITVLVSYLF